MHAHIHTHTSVPLGDLGNNKTSQTMKTEAFCARKEGNIAEQLSTAQHVYTHRMHSVCLGPTGLQHLGVRGTKATALFDVHAAVSGMLGI